MEGVRGPAEGVIVPGLGVGDDPDDLVLPGVEPFEGFEQLRFGGPLAREDRGQAVDEDLLQRGFRGLVGFLRFGFGDSGFFGLCRCTHCLPICWMYSCSP
jgi:hypothetical protein